MHRLIYHFLERSPRGGAYPGIARAVRQQFLREFSGYESERENGTEPEERMGFLETLGRLEGARNRIAIENHESLDQLIRDLRAVQFARTLKARVEKNEDLRPYAERLGFPTPEKERAYTEGFGKRLEARARKIAETIAMKNQKSASQLNSAVDAALQEAEAGPPIAGPEKQKTEPAAFPQATPLDAAVMALFNRLTPTHVPFQVGQRVKHAIRQAESGTRLQTAMKTLTEQMDQVEPNAHGKIRTTKRRVLSLAQIHALREGMEKAMKAGASGLPAIQSPESVKIADLEKHAKTAMDDMEFIVGRRTAKGSPDKGQKEANDHLLDALEIAKALKERYSE